MSRELDTIPRKGLPDGLAVYRHSSSPEAGNSSSPHGTPGPDLRNEEHGYDTNTPPAYSGPTSPPAPPTSLAPRQIPVYPGLPRLDYTLYAPAKFSLSNDATTLTSYSPTFSIYPSGLVPLIKSLASVPPKPQVRIYGKQWLGPETNVSAANTDFDIRLNIMNLIVPEDDKSRMNYLKIIEKGEMGYRGGTKQSDGGRSVEELGSLEDWARVFCEDAAAIKHFTLERTITNWDKSYLHGRLLSLISSTPYCGHVTINFPVTHSRVVVHSPDKVNRFFSNITKVFTGTRKYEVVKSIWPYADVARGDPARRCVVQDEEKWFEEWRDAIRHAIIMGRKGWVTAEDRLEFLMEPRHGEVGIGN